MCLSCVVSCAHDTIQPLFYRGVSCMTRCKTSCMRFSASLGGPQSDILRKTHVTVMPACYRRRHPRHCCWGHPPQAGSSMVRPTAATAVLQQRMRGTCDRGETWVSALAAFSSPATSLPLRRASSALLRDDESPPPDACRSENSKSCGLCTHSTHAHQRVHRSW